MISRRTFVFGVGLGALPTLEAISRGNHLKCAAIGLGEYGLYQILSAKMMPQIEICGICDKSSHAVERGAKALATPLRRPVFATQSIVELLNRVPDCSLLVSVPGSAVISVAEACMATGSPVLIDPRGLLTSPVGLITLQQWSGRGFRYMLGSAQNSWPNEELHSFLRFALMRGVRNLEIEFHGYSSAVQNIAGLMFDVLASLYQVPLQWSPPRWTRHQTFGPIQSWCQSLSTDHSIDVRLFSSGSFPLKSCKIVARGAGSEFQATIDEQAHEGAPVTPTQSVLSFTQAFASTASKIDQMLRSQELALKAATLTGIPS